MVRKDYTVKSLVAFAAVAVAAAAVAAPAFAQSLPALAPITYNAGLGFTGVSLPRTDVGAITLRAGADFGKYLGVEAEGAFGVVDADGQIGATTTKAHLNDEYAAYALARYPVLTNGSLFARVGYGHTDLKLTATDMVSSVSASGTARVDSWNYGAGAQYFFSGKNGVRVDYTRFDFRARGLTDADTWTVSYVRKF